MCGGLNLCPPSLEPLHAHFFHYHRYEGGGLFRDVFITSSSLPLRIPESGLFAPAIITGGFHARASPAEGVTADGATIAPVLSVENAAPPGGAAAFFTAQFTLFDASGAAVNVSARSASFNVSAGAVIVVPLPPLALAAPELWSVARPYLYSLEARLYGAGADAGTLYDARTVPLGVRSIRWDALFGAFINEQPVKLRGFCNHASFGGGVVSRVWFGVLIIHRSALVLTPNLSSPLLLLPALRAWPCPSA